MANQKKHPSRKGVKTPRPGLTPKSAAFVENMAKDLPPGASAAFAGYPDDQAPVLAQQLMKKPHIKEAIAKRKMDAALHAKITPEMVLGATVMRAFCSIDDAFDEFGNFSIEKARETGAIHLIKKYEKKGNNYKVEFYDNAAAQDKLGNYLGMEFAPKDNNDANSLKEGIEKVAKEIAGDKPVTRHHRVEAFNQVMEWAKDSRARYSKEAIQEVSREFSN